jgi:3-deoxy-D-manno-octulosonate 8-phosphate phosphatase (KDO 8-P phosphatase)
VKHVEEEQETPVEEVEQKLVEMSGEEARSQTPTHALAPTEGEENAPQKRAREQKELLARITVFGIDVDGVLTDSKMYFGRDDDEVVKGYSTRDGMGFFLMRAAGITPVLITGDDTESIRARAKRWGVEEIHLRERYKEKRLDEVLTRLGKTWEETAFLGDDLNDVPPMRRAALGIAPYTAAAEARMAADVITDAPGGMGAVREVVDMLIAARGFDPEAIYLDGAGER